MPGPVPTLRAMPLRPHAVPSVILAGTPLAGAGCVYGLGWLSCLECRALVEAADRVTWDCNKQQHLGRRGSLDPPPLTGIASVKCKVCNITSLLPLPHPPPCSGRGQRHRGNAGGQRGGDFRLARPARHAAPGQHLPVLGSVLEAACVTARLPAYMVVQCRSAAAPLDSRDAMSPAGRLPVLRHRWQLMLFCLLYTLLSVQLADFNFDGYTDILLVSHDGIWGWAQVGGLAVTVILHSRCPSTGWGWVGERQAGLRCCCD